MFDVAQPQKRKSHFHVTLFSRISKKRNPASGFSCWLHNETVRIQPFIYASPLSNDSSIVHTNTRRYTLRHGSKEISTDGTLDFIVTLLWRSSVIGHNLFTCYEARFQHI